MGAAEVLATACNKQRKVRKALKVVLDTTHTADTPPIMKSTERECQVSNQEDPQDAHSAY